MPIDFSKTLTQLPNLIDRLNFTLVKKNRKLNNAQLAIENLNVNETNSRALNGKATWLSSGLIEHPVNSYVNPPYDSDHIVIAVDGSHVDVDRHASAFYYLINIGYAYLRYGNHPDANLWNHPFLFVNDSDLTLDDLDSMQSIQIEGPLLGIKRSIMEVEAIAQLVEEEQTELPIIALLDGSLIFWSLTGHSYPDFVRETFLEKQLMGALDRIKTAGSLRKVALASYISLPRSKEVVNSLRLSICPYNPIDCNLHCGSLPSEGRPCDDVDGLFDIDLMRKILKKNERSAIFFSNSNVMDHYKDHRICYFYVNTGSEIGRVELPRWVAEDEQLLNLLHSGLIAQLSKGQGYPIAIQEAHEQAVVNTSDRVHLNQLVQELMVGEGLSVDTSEKARSKRTRFI